MENAEERYSKKILTQLLILAVAVVLVGLWQADFLRAVYAENQITNVGWFINGGIMLLFLAGIYHIVREFNRLSAEEKAISRLLGNLNERASPLDGVAGHTLIAQRYEALEDLHRQHAVINHSALAATLVALESSRVSFLNLCTMC